MAIFFADAHSQEKAWADKPIKGDALFALEQIFDYALAHGIHHIFGGGDLIDKQRNRSLPVTHFHQQINRLKELGGRGGRFYYIQGQHDYDDPPWLAGNAVAQHIDHTGVLLGSAMEAFRVYGLDYQPRENLPDALATIPAETDILLCHQVWGDWMGSITLPQGNFADIPTVKTVITGDYHEKRSESYRGKDGQAMAVYSTGATCMQTIAEPTKHYFLVLSSDGTFKFEKLRSRVAFEWSVMNRPEDVDAFVKEIDADLARVAVKAEIRQLPPDLVMPIIRITYSHRLTDAVRRVEKAVKGRAHLFWNELPPEEKKTVRVAITETVSSGKQAEVTPLTELPKVVKPDDDPETFALLTRLLNASDIQMELAAWRTEFMGESNTKGT